MAKHPPGWSRPRPAARSRRRCSDCLWWNYLGHGALGHCHAPGLLASDGGPLLERRTAAEFRCESFGERGDSGGRSVSGEVAPPLPDDTGGARSYDA
mgnify:CR=1 FL=1